MVGEYIRQHHLGLIAIFIALTGTAYASNQISEKPSPKAASAKAKKGPRGPQGPQGPQGLPGPPGQDGSPDSAGQVLTKVLSVDGAGSGLDADKLDNLDSSDIGLGYFTGRVNDLALTGSTGNAPSGVTASTSDTTLANQNMTLSPNRAIVMRNLAVSLSQPMGCTGICGTSEVGTLTLEAFPPASGSPTASISCNLLSGTSTCTAAGPSATVPAASSLRVRLSKSLDSQFNAGTDALFSWQATAP